MATRPNKAFLEALKNAWHQQARSEQLPPPGDWTTWVFCGGRGSGKTRSGAEWVNDRVTTGKARFIHLIAPTAADCRDVLLEGPAGILTIASSHVRPVYQPSLRKVTWSNGTQALLFSSDEPDRLRGPQCDTLWIDELCAMRTAQDVIDMAYMGLRLGKDPRALITTTPRPIKAFKALLARDGQDVRVTRSSSYANRENLAPQFFAQIVAKYEGTRLGRQEIEAELLTDVPGALWHLERIEELRVQRAPHSFERVIVAVDPAVTFGPDSDETGIVIVGLGPDGEAYVLDDVSGRYPPQEWAQRAIQAYRVYRADRIIGEINNGGALVEHTLRSVDPGIPFKAVHASRGKLTRAEPVSALYEQGRVHHVGVFGPLEDQLTSYDGSRTGSSPDRLDALVWGLTELMLGEPAGGFIKVDSLLARPADGLREPIPCPKKLDGAFASVAAGIGSEPDSVGVVFFGFDRFTATSAPLVVLNWYLIEVAANTIDTLMSSIQARVQHYRQNIWFRGDNGGSSMIGGVLIDPDGLGGLFHANAEFRGDTAMLINDPAHLKMAPTQRAVAAAAYVGDGRVQIAREAHEQTVDYRGINRNHLMHAIGSFGLQQAPDQAGALLIAFCNGVIHAFQSGELRRQTV